MDQPQQMLPLRASVGGHPLFGNLARITEIATFKGCNRARQGTIRVHLASYPTGICPVNGVPATGCAGAPVSRAIGRSSEFDPKFGACVLISRLVSGPNSDNRLSCAAFLRTECSHRIVEGRNGADVRPDATVAHALDDLA